MLLIAVIPSSSHNLHMINLQKVMAKRSDEFIQIQLKKFDCLIPKDGVSEKLNLAIKKASNNSQGR